MVGKNRFVRSTRPLALHPFRGPFLGFRPFELMERMERGEETEREKDRRRRSEREGEEAGRGRWRQEEREGERGRETEIIIIIIIIIIITHHVTKIRHWSN